MSAFDKARKAGKVQSKNTSKGGKTPNKPGSGDGRANPAVLDVSKFDQFADGVKTVKLSKVVAQQVSSTPIAHQSGSGDRGIRESLNGHSKTAVIRWLAARGIDEGKARRAIASLFKMMTPGVWAKNWAKGEAGIEVTELDPTSVATLKSLCK